MSLGIESDTQLQLGPLTLEAIAGLGVKLDTMTSELRKLRRIEESYEFGAVEHPIRKTSMSPATGSLYMGLGGPSYGRMWELRRLSVGGSLWTTTVAGSLILCIGPNTAQLTPALPDVVDQVGSLPSIATYSTRQVVVRHPNHLFVVILTPTASTQYAIGGSFTEYPDRREEIETSN